MKIVNAVQVLHAPGSTDWPGVMVEGMMDWAGRYLYWLQASQQGSESAGHYQVSGPISSSISGAIAHDR